MTKQEAKQYMEDHIDEIVHPYILSEEVYAKQPQAIARFMDEQDRDLRNAYSFSLRMLYFDNPYILFHIHLPETPRNWFERWQYKVELWLRKRATIKYLRQYDSSLKENVIVFALMTISGIEALIRASAEPIRIAKAFVKEQETCVPSE